MNDITTYLDGSIYLTDEDLQVLTDVDDTVDAAIARGDPSAVFAMGRMLHRRGHAFGLAKARLLTLLEDRWELFSDDDFEDSIQAEMGIPGTTTRKYTQMYRAVHYRLQQLQSQGKVDNETVKRIAGMPMSTQLLLTAGAREGQFDSKWKEISETTTKAEVQKIVRKVRGYGTSSSKALKIYITVKGPGRGTLSARRGQGKYVNIGHLNVAAEDEVSQQAITRIIEKIGVIER